MLGTSLAALLETALNTWLALDAQTHGTARQQLQTLQGKLICIHLLNPDLKLYFIPTTDNLRVSAAYAAEPDVTIRGTALAFARLNQAEDAGKAMLEQGIQIDGDMGLGNRFSQILRTAEVDWEELLARVVGDTVAHQAGQLARHTRGWLSDSAQAMRLNTQEYLQEEARLLPAIAELQAYYDAVDALRMDADRLDARIQRLEGLLPKA